MMVDKRENKGRLRRRVVLLLLGCVCGLQYLSAQENLLQPFPLDKVTLLESPFKQAQETDLHYMLALSPDRLLAPFLREAGLPSKAPSYGNWENTGLDGHIGGHYLSALAFMYAATGNQPVKERLEYMLGELEKCQAQDPDGYVGGIPGGKAMWQEISAGKIEASSFALNGKWVPLYNIHKLFAGLIDVYRVTGNEQAKNILLKLSSWFWNTFAHLSDEQLQQMLVSEQGGINEALADVAQISHNPRYLDLAKRCSHRAVLEPLIARQDQLTGLHANTQIPKVIGFEKIAESSRENQWHEAARFFWETVVYHRSVSIGGNSVREHFHPSDDFSGMLSSVEGPETCNTYNMLKLSKLLFLQGGDGTYMDFYERALFNHILSSQHPGQGGFVYFTPMRPNHYRVYSQPQLGFWCCVGSGMENHGKYGELIYAHQGDDVFVNLFIASMLRWKEKGMVLKQETTFPYKSGTRFTLTLEKPASFALHIRKPAWLRRPLQIKVNGEAAVFKDEQGYVSLERSWNSGDRITLELPMEIAASYLPDSSSWVSFTYGPIVLGAKTGTQQLTGLFAGGERMGHIANGPLVPLDRSPMLVGEKTSLLDAIRLEDDRKLSFRLNRLQVHGKDTTMELVPFSSIHDARYMVYWPFVNRRDLDSVEGVWLKREQAARALQEKTVDMVYLGEQQPESDHGFKGEETYTGIEEDRHWRASRQWFSYELRDPDEKGRKIQIRREKGAGCYALSVNGKLLDLTKQSSLDEKEILDEYRLEDVPPNRTHTWLVKVVACAQENTGKLFEIRLLIE